MFKKMLIVSSLFLFIASFSDTAGAATTVYSPNGYYKIVSGKLNASVNFPGYFTLTIGLPNIAVFKDLLGGCFVFYYWVDEYDEIISYNYGPFAIYIPIDFSSITPTLPLTNQPQPLLEYEVVEPTTVGLWEMTGSNKFMIRPMDADTGEIIDIEQTINDLLATQDFPLNMITVDVTKYSFTGSVNKDASLKTSLSLEILINAFITTGKITLTGSFTTSKPSSSPPELPSLFSAPKKNLRVSSQELANWVVKILKTLPLKDAMPAN